jgi:hypothetical protein
LVFGFSLAFAAGKEGTSQAKGFVSVDNQKTGLTWRFYHDVKGNRRLAQGFCQDPANDGGHNWRLPIRKEFETLIADPAFKFPPDLAAEYYSREVRDTYGHDMSPQELSRTGTSMGSVYLENSDALVFDVAKKKFNWRFVTNEYSVACVAPLK